MIKKIRIQVLILVSSLSSTKMFKEKYESKQRTHAKERSKWRALHFSADINIINHICSNIASDYFFALVNE